MKKLFVFLSIVFALSTSSHTFPSDSISVNLDDVFLIQDEDTIVQKKSYYLYDTVFIEKRSFDQEKLTKYRTDSRFDYGDRGVKEPERNNFWLQKLMYHIIKWVAKFFEGFYSVVTTENGTLSWVFYVGTIVLITLLLFFLLRVFQGRIFKKGKGEESTDLDYDTFTEDINEMDFDTLLQESIDKKLYRRAVRILFLKSLKELIDKNLIQWEENKTNQDYIYEIKSRTVREGFEHVSDVFEYVWYGEVELNSNVFTQVQKEFITFSKQIK